MLQRTGLRYETPRLPGRNFTGLGRTTVIVAAPFRPDAATQRLVLARDGHACACCGRSIIGQPYRILQRKRRWAGGDYSAPNLITVAGTAVTGCCGRIESRSDPLDEAHGYVVRPGDDPAKIPVMHASSGVVWLAADGTCRHEEPRA